MTEIDHPGLRHGTRRRFIAGALFFGHQSNIIQAMGEQEELFT